MTWLDGIDPESVKDVLVTSYHVLVETREREIPDHESLLSPYNWEEDEGLVL
jgi:hypothetical protein